MTSDIKSFREIIQEVEKILFNPFFKVLASNDPDNGNLGISNKSKKACHGSDRPFLFYYVIQLTIKQHGVT